MQKMLPPAGMSLTLRNSLEFPSYQGAPCIYDAKDALYREPKVGRADPRNHRFRGHGADGFRAVRRMV